MFLQIVAASNFKPFSELRVELAETPRLVVACGMNGTGKSSFIDALSHWRQQSHFGIQDPPYYARGGLPSSPGASVAITFHGDQPLDRRSAVYVRTAHRVTVEFNIGNIGQLDDVLNDPGPRRSIDLDTRVEQNFRRLVGESVQRLWSPDGRDRTAGEIVDELVGTVHDPLARLLPGLVFEGPGDNPLSNGTFEFTKGSSSRYPYKLLSGGEKAVFDVLLDFAAKRRTFANTVYCLDEPELHVNARIHGALLDEILLLIPHGSQLILATHSAGILARARTIANENPEDVAFLDFDGHNYETSVTLAPVTPDRAFWRRQLEIAFGGFADLLAPSRVVLCEGEASGHDTPRASFDARCLGAIFGDDMPDTAFMASGNSHDVANDRLKLAERITALVDGVEFIRLIDRDSRSATELEEMKASGVRVLSRRNLESFLLSDDALAALCKEYEMPGKAHELLTSRDAALSRAASERQRQPDDYKGIRGEVVTAARALLSITQGGSGADQFLRDTVAPLLRPGMRSYDDLRSDIFGPRSNSR